MKTRQDDQTLYLIPETDLVASRISALRDYFLEELEATDAGHIVLDVHGVDIVDSLGVNLIVGLYRQATAESRTIEIVGAGDKFMKVANFFRLPAIFSIRGQET